MHMGSCLWATDCMHIWEWRFALGEQEEENPATSPSLSQCSQFPLSFQPLTIVTAAVWVLPIAFMQGQLWGVTCDISAVSTPEAAVALRGHPSKMHQSIAHLAETQAGWGWLRLEGTLGCRLVPILWASRTSCLGPGTNSFESQEGDSTAALENLSQCSLFHK